MTSKNTILLKMAAALLLKNGKLSVREIQSLPFVDNVQLARAIALSLYNRFELELDNDILRLKSKTLRPKKVKKLPSQLSKNDLIKKVGNFRF